MTTAHFLRKCIKTMLNELVSPIEVDDKVWSVDAKPSPGFGDYPGIDVKGYMKTLRTSHLPVTSVALVRKRFEKDAVIDDRAPEDARPVDVVKAIKIDSPYTNDEGVTFVPISGAQENVARKAAQAIAHLWKGKGVDLVSTVESKSELANTFGAELSKILGASFIPRGILKGIPTIDVPDDMSDKDKTSIKRSFDKNIAKGFAMKSVPGRLRNRVKLNMTPSDDIIDKITQPGQEKKLNVLLVDDIVTSGSTLDGAAEALNNEAIKVIGCAVIFKMEDVH